MHIHRRAGQGRHSGERDVCSLLRNAHAMHRLVLDSTVELAGSGDFMVNGRYSFEEGERKKVSSRLLDWSTPTSSPMTWR
jgi:hypothetical protein